MKSRFALPLAISLGIEISGGSILDSVASDTVSGGGTGNTLFDISTDTWFGDLNSSGGTVFIGWDWTIDNNAGESGSGGFFGGLGLYNFGDERLLAGNSWESLNFDAGAGTAFEDSGVAYQVGETARLVLELTVNAGAATDTFRLWVNPTSAADEGSPDGERTDWGLDPFTTLYHRAGNTTGQATLENLIVATTFSEAAAAPEASEALIVLMGMTGLLGYRRRAR